MEEAMAWAGVFGARDDGITSGIYGTRFFGLVPWLKAITQGWHWTLDGSSEFSVASARKVMNRFPEVSTQTRWIKAVPIKVNIHAWKERSEDSSNWGILRTMGIIDDVSSYAGNVVKIHSQGNGENDKQASVVALGNEGFTDIDLRYMGGLWVMIAFDSVEAKEKFLLSTGVCSWFSQLIQASSELTTDEQVTMVEIEGIPLKVWNESTFIRIASKWGTLLNVENLEKGNYHCKDLCSHEEELADLKMIIDKGDASSDTLHKRAEVVKSIQEVDKLCAMEASQKAKIKMGQLNGEEELKYYHWYLNKKRNQLSIRGVLVEGDWVENPNMVKNEFLNHFKNRFDRPKSVRPMLNMEFPHHLN
ncbi:hypothetical protein Tco_1217285 [Tanacetum coccineum]